MARRSGGRTSAFRGLVVALVVAVLAGCGGVPEGGNAVVVRTLPNGGVVRDESVFSVRPPAAGLTATPLAAVQGFIAAAISTDDRHAIARTYLTPDADKVWQDGGVVQLVRGSLTYSAESAGVVRLRGSVIGSIGGDGSFTPHEQVLDLRVRTRKVGSAWRVDSVPTGVIIRLDDFGRAYSPSTLYFAAVGQPQLVPDLRYFDGSVLGNAKPSQLVRALLAGPSKWLAPGVRTVFPAGTRLRGNVVQDGQALVVDLTAEAEQAAPADRALMSAELVWSLVSVGLAVSEVRVEVEGRPFVVPGAGASQNSALWSAYNVAASAGSAVPPYYVTPSGGIRRLPSASSRQKSPSPDTPAVPSATGAAISRDETVLAVVRATAASRRQLLVGPKSGPLRPVLVAGAMTTPAFLAGRTEALLAVDGTRVVTLTPSGHATPIAVPDLASAVAAGARILQLRLSLDGTRVAIVVGSHSRSSLLVGVLTLSGGVLSIRNLRPIAPDLDGIADVVWADTTELFVIAHGADGYLQPWDVTSDGVARNAVVRNGLPSSSTMDIAAAPPTAVMVSVRGILYQRFNQGWASPSPSTVIAGSLPFWPS